MKTTIKRFSAGKPRDNSPRPFEVLGKLLGRLFGALAVSALLIAAAGAVRPAIAANNATAFIVVRCTVTLSVTLVEPNTSFVLGDVSAGQTINSSGGVDIRNDSQGAICNWDLYVDTNTMGNWELADAPGLNQVAIYGVFQKTKNDSNFDVTRDSFSATPRDYKSDDGDGGVFACGSYSTEGLGGVESKIIPYQCSPARSDRKLWIRMMTPLAVTDEAPRTIHMVITGKMAG